MAGDGDDDRDDERPRRRTTRQSAAAASSPNVDLTYYNTVSGAKGGNRGGKKNKIQVVSKKKLDMASQEEYHERLSQKFDKIERERRSKEEEAASSAPAQSDDDNAALGGRILLVTHVNTFLYAACFFIQVGTLPYLTKKLGADATIYGQIQTVFAVAQLVGGVLYGRLGDLFSDRTALLVAFASAAASYTITGFAHSLPMLFLSRIFCVLMHVMQGSQMIITYFSTESNRASALSRLGFSYGLGMVVGPTVGGYVTKFMGEQQASLVSAFGSIVSLLLVYLFIPHVPKKKQHVKSKKTTDQKESGQSLFSVSAITRLLALPGVGILLLIKTVCGVPIGILQSMFSVVAIERFSMPAEQNGMMLSYIGAVSLFMQGAGIAVATRLLSERAAMIASTVVLTLSYYVLTLISEVFEFLVVLFPLTCSLCIVNSILTASVTKTVDKSESGAMLGLNMAVHSIIRSVAPTIGGYLMSNYGFESLGYVGVACNIVALSMVARTMQD